MIKVAQTIFERSSYSEVSSHNSDKLEVDTCDIVISSASSVRYLTVMSVTLGLYCCYARSKSTFLYGLVLEF